MRTMHHAARRLKRGDLYHPGRYWSAFFAFSLVVHIAMLAGLAGAAESFISSLPRPKLPSPPVLYVSLFFQPPGEIGGTVPAAAPLITLHAGKEKSAAPVRSRAAAGNNRKAPAHVKNTVPPVTAPPGPRPAPGKTAPDLRATRKINPGPPVKLAMSSPLQTHATTPVAVKEASQVSDVQDDGHIMTVEKDAVRMYREFFEPSDNSIVVIKGTDITRERTDKPAQKPVQDIKHGPPSPSISDEEIAQPVTVPERVQHADVPDARPVPLDIPEPFEGVYDLPEHFAEGYGKDTSQTPLDEAKPYRRAVVLASAERRYSIPMAEPNETAPISANGHTQVVDTMKALAAYLLADTGLAAYATVSPQVEPVPLVSHTLAGPTQVSPRSQAIPEPEARIPSKIIIVAEDPDEPDSPPVVSISAPAPGGTGQGLVDVTGVATGAGVRSVMLWHGDRKMEVLVKDGGFTKPVSLDYGKNVLVAVTADSAGRTARDRVVVNYRKAGTGLSVRINYPADGATVDAFKRKNLDIKGSVDGEGVETVRMYLNNSIMDIPVTGGAFSYRAPVEAEENTLFVEATDADGVTSRSDTVRFTAFNLHPMDLNVKVDMDGGRDGISLVRRWRPHPLAGPDGPAGPSFIDSAGYGGLSAGAEKAVPGIYTVGVSHDIPPGKFVTATFRVTLYGYDESKKVTRTAGPVTLHGKGYLPAVRMLLPETVFWEDDGWFSGVVDSSSGTMKFRQPEGISWTEED